MHRHTAIRHFFGRGLTFILTGDGIHDTVKYWLEKAAASKGTYYQPWFGVTVCIVIACTLVWCGEIKIQTSWFISFNNEFNSIADHVFYIHVFHRNAEHVLEQGASVFAVPATRFLFSGACCDLKVSRTDGDYTWTGAVQPRFCGESNLLLLSDSR